MSRGFNAIGVILTGVCGILVAYTTLQPELENQKLEQLGETKKAAPTGDKVVSEAIKGDFEEARQQVVQPGGFAWGIRKMLFEKKEAGQTTGQAKDAEVNKPDSTGTATLTKKEEDGR